MRFGKVVGNVVLNHQETTLKGARWLIVVPMGKENFENLSSYKLGTEPSVVVYDSLGARTGDIIGFTEGGEAALPFENPTPIDAYNAVIVNQINYSG